MATPSNAQAAIFRDVLSNPLAFFGVAAPWWLAEIPGNYHVSALPEHLQYRRPPYGINMLTLKEAIALNLKS